MQGSITLVSIMYTVLYGVCLNVDLFIHDRVATSTLEHAESQQYLMPSRLVCPQCDAEKSIPTEHRLVTHANHLLYITSPSIMMEGIQQTQHTDLHITHNTMQGSVPLPNMYEHMSYAYEIHAHSVYKSFRYTAPSIVASNQR